MKVKEGEGRRRKEKEREGKRRKEKEDVMTSKNLTTHTWQVGNYSI